MSSSRGRPGEGSTRAGGRWTSLALNAVLSLLYLLVAPLTEVPHRDYAVLVGSYFTSFLLADSTTTNALGIDVGRVRRRLRAGVPLRHILLAKNLTLLLVVGVPTLATTTVVTLNSEPIERLALTLPAVLVTVLVWLGLGNLASVLLPVTALPLRQRWQQRRNLPSTGRWSAVVALPYVLCFVVDPLAELPTLAFRGPAAGTGTAITVPAAVLLGCGVLGYAGLTAAALRSARRRGLRFHDVSEGTRHTRVAPSSLVLAA